MTSYAPLWSVGATDESLRSLSTFLSYVRVSLNPHYVKTTVFGAISNLPVFILKNEIKLIIIQKLFD